MARFLLDTSPLRRSVDFRRLFVGQTVSMVGTQLAAVGLAYQVYSITGSSLQVGAVSMVQLIPFVAGTLWGGHLGDVVDRRRLLMVCIAAMAFTSGGLALNAADRPGSVAVIYCLSALSATSTGVVAAVTVAAVPSLVGSEGLTGAFAVMQVVDQVGMVLGPALAGGLIAAIGLPWLYGIDALSYVWALAMVAGMSAMARPEPAPAIGRPDQSIRTSIVEGFGYLRGRQSLQGAFAVDLGATVFGLPRALFPAMARSIYQGGPTTLGLLYAAPAAGALVVSLTSGWIGSLARQGRAVLVAVALWGAAIVGLGYARALWLALGLLVVAGGADVVSAVLRSTIVQESVADDVRARVSSLQMAVVEGGPRLGDLESGAVASAFSVRASVVSGGLACLAVTAVIGTLLRGFRRYRPPASEVDPARG